MWTFFSSFSYDNAWKEVDKEAPVHPKTALEKISNIEKHAKSEKNYPQWLCCIIKKHSVVDDIQDSAVMKILDELELFKQSDAPTAAKSMASLLKAKAYTNFFRHNSYKINQRTDLFDTIPDDIEEWTTRQFRDTIRALYSLALSDASLRTTKSTDYEAIIDLYKDSRLYRPTLFDLTVHYILDNNNSPLKIYSDEECVNLHKQLIDFHKNDNDKHAYVLANLDYLKITNPETLERKGKFVEFLNEMNDNEASMLIRVELVSLLSPMIPDKEELVDSSSVMPSEIVEICEEGIRKFPKHPLVKQLENNIKNLKVASYSIRLDRDRIHSKDSVKLTIEYANKKNVKISLYRYNVTPQQWFGNGHHIEYEKSKINTFTVNLEPSDFCIKKSTHYEIPALDYGVYCIEAEEKNNTNNPHNNYFDFVVSDLYVLYQDNLLDNPIIVVDAKSGTPKQLTNIDIYKFKNYHECGELIDIVHTDKNGFAFFTYPTSNSRYGSFFSDQKDIFTYMSVYPYEKANCRKNDNQGLKTRVFTDRSIYRPGQTVYFKCIVYKIDQKSSVVPNEKIHIDIYDADYQQIKEMDLITNEFGTVASSFVVPPTGLSGNYTIRVDYGERHTISVEEYKRPTFEVSMSVPTESFTFNDSISLKGRADYLMGVPLTNGSVAYKITRRDNLYFWWWSTGEPDKIVASGTVQTDENGDFSISFVPSRDEESNKSACYRYEVEVSVTDLSGETQQESIHFSVGDVSMAIVVPHTIDKLLVDDLSTIKFYVVNLNFQGIQKEVSYSVFRKVENDKQLVAKGNVISDVENGFTINESTTNWESGQYDIEFVAFDDRGREVSQHFSTVLYRSTDTVPPIVTDFWSESVGEYDVSSDEKKTVRIGTSLHGAHLLVLVADEKEWVRKEWVDLDNEIKSFEFSLGHSEALNVRFFMVHDGQLESAELNLRKKSESHSIPLQLSVFRDKMQPGEKENWTMTVPKEYQVELLATMYDASLDQIRPHSWNFNPEYRMNYYFCKWNHLTNSKRSLWWNQPGNGPVYYDFIFDQLYSYEEMHLTARVRKSSLCCNIVQETLAISDDESVLTGSVCSISYEYIQPSTAYKETDNKTKVRTNFNEMAFFYPQLTSNEKGEIQLSFTMPESLTKWKFMAIAHTKDLHYGSLIQQAVTQKQFMITPNLPRFLRMGDHCTMAAKVFNLSDKPQTGTAKLELLDPVSEKVIIEKSVSFTVDTKKDTAVKWEVDIPHDYEAFIVRTSAIAENFSDAEQKLLPVLSDRIILTQSLPMIVRGEKTKNYTLENLANNDSKTLSTRFLKLELCTNPIWYAVQSLPSIADVKYENAISFSTAHFATSMANKIATSNPRIFKVIEMWKMQNADKKTLLSNLEKNEEVKNVLLNETPWVMEGKTESERKQRLTSLFDVNELKGKSDLWLKKLNELQLSDGGFSWFKGGEYSSRHTTLFIVDNFGRLKKAGVDISSQTSVIEKSIHYLDEELKHDYEWLKKYDKNYKTETHVSMYELYYFQVRSIFDEPLEEKYREAYDFYYSLMKKQWSEFSLYGKSLAAIALYHGGDKAEALAIARSLREFSSTTEDMGMYWKKNVSGYFWQDQAISTHTRCMEALALVDYNREEQDELRIWLLNQKRTQNWDNEIANIDALNVLLSNGSDWISNDNQVTVKLAGEKVTPEKKEAGTGYFCTQIQGKDVTPQMASVQLQSAEGGNASWGALYWQFEEEMEKVKSNKSALYIEKSVMLEQVDNDKNVLKQINDDTKLKVGDKLVVRLTLRTDRDMEYVSLKDQRASCLEPLLQISGYHCSENTCYYQSQKDASMYYFFEHLHKGTYVFEYRMWVTSEGNYSNGITSVQCLYAPEFSSNTGSVRINVGQ